MPKKLEQALKREASKRGYTGKRKDAYVYGTMRNTGWKPKKERDKSGDIQSDGTYKTAAFGGGGP